MLSHVWNEQWWIVMKFVLNWDWPIPVHTVNDRSQRPAHFSYCCYVWQATPLSLSQCINKNNYIIKYSDDTVILSLLQKDHDILAYQSEIENFVRWCNVNHLIINASKTKEMIIDPKRLGDYSSVIIYENIIEQVDTYKYLGVVIDRSFTWKARIDYLCSKF